MKVTLSSVNPFSANPTKWSNKLKQFVGNLPTNCLSDFEHFVKLALKGLNQEKIRVLLKKKKHKKKQKFITSVKIMLTNKEKRNITFFSY